MESYKTELKIHGNPDVFLTVPQGGLGQKSAGVTPRVFFFSLCSALEVEFSFPFDLYPYRQQVIRSVNMVHSRNRHFKLSLIEYLLLNGVMFVL